MASTSESITLDRKKIIAAAMYKYASSSPDDVGNDGMAIFNNDELKKWITFPENFPIDSEACFKTLSELNEDLTLKSVLVGGGLKPSEADIVVFSTVHSSVIGLPHSDRNQVPHLMRWIDYIQNVYEFGELFERILLEKAPFDPPLVKSVEKVEVESITKKVFQGSKGAESEPESKKNYANSEAESKKNADVKKVAGKNEAVAEKKKMPEKVADEKDKDLSVSLLKIQVGLIRKASKHPSADSLLVEEIEVGERKCRQVVSGLAKYCSPDDLVNRLVVLITNVKPGKLRDVISEGLVLCASNEDQTVVEPLMVPEGAKIGECVTFSGFEGKPEDVLNPKKKQLDKITPHLFTNDKGVATFKGVPFMTSGGPCTSSISKATIK